MWDVKMQKICPGGGVRSGWMWMKELEFLCKYEKKSGGGGYERRI